MLVRDDDRSNRSMVIHRQDLTRRGTPDFSQAHNEFDRKLAEVERHLASKRRDERAILLAEEEARKELAEDAANKIIEEEKAGCPVLFSSAAPKASWPPAEKHS